MKKGTCFEKRALKISPYQIPFLSVLHQNKDLYNFRKKGQLSIVERNINLNMPCQILCQNLDHYMQIIYQNLDSQHQESLVFVLSIFLIEILLWVDLYS